ncbi:hypothetical protein AKJ09_06570 [Labilithrix luteola]|uniref:Lipoprotein n=1 Tax=Labilithrix luteola TaxID=1391654 RepID=A0A0K1Q2N8_9BACT|nr:hypothetical protein [Labilithrix luteola]AKU99906.1 hypothetical protein AKJ09_06570 [Labilithrix luteola]
MERKHLVGSCCIALALVAFAPACTEKEKGGSTKTPASEAMGTFTFAPPDGTTFVRTEHRTYEVSVAGTPVSRREESELRWRVSTTRSGDEFLIDQELEHLTVKHDDKTVADGDLKPGAISAQLVVDHAGNLVDVRGLKDTSATLRSVAGPNLDKEDAQMISPEGLKDMVSMRFQALTGDLVGHPATQGTTWTIQGRPGSGILSRTITVEAMETCGSAQCARLREDIKVDPQALNDLGNELIKDYREEMGAQGKQKVHAENASSSMTATLVVEPSTMLAHDATLNETGQLTFKGAKRSLQVNMRGQTQFKYEYGAKVAHR